MKKVTKGIKYVLLLIVGLITGIFLVGIVSGAKDALSGSKADAIKKTLTANCQCDEINQFIYAQGIQYSKTDGLSTEKAEYELVNCKYENITKEVARINELLANQVAGYEDLDLLKLEFVGTENHQTFIIKNAQIQ
ncbi:hypothetical protein [Dokdonia sp. Hel_I_53]|uniref:hypothetical protein n=1 Tax=Dokdonia sp. Hel_I_53 TaxID=1566287 RepID=UPI00119C3D28|nr:hypothetical protein [Dokdonia sp. Hel_I_53]TVZ52539.1 hypothetical protein OD90_1716 [Dokdonia sp. Hel_I_53]